MVERKKVPAPYLVRTHEHVEFYVEEDELPKYQECVLLSHKELVAYVKANLEQFEIITPREDQLSSPVDVRGHPKCTTDGHFPRGQSAPLPERETPPPGPV